MKFLRLISMQKQQQEEAINNSWASSSSSQLTNDSDHHSGRSSSSSSSTSRCDHSAKLTPLLSFQGDQAAAMTLTLIKDHQYLYMSKSRQINTIDCSRRSELSIVSSFALKCPPVRAIVVAGTAVYTAHLDRKIRVWTRTITGTTSDSQEELILKHKLVATLPSLRETVSSRLLQSSLQNSQQRHHPLRRQSRPQPLDTARRVQHRDVISALATALSGSILYSASWDKTIKVWSITSSIKYVESFVAHDDAINALAVADHSSSGSSGGGNDGSTVVFSASASGEIKAWKGSHHRRQNRERITSKTSHCLIATIRGHKSAVNALLWSHHSTLLYSGSGDKTIRAWSPQGPGYEVAEVLRGHKAAVLCLAATTDGEFLCSGAADKSVRIWRRHCCVAAMELHCSPVKSLAIVPDSGSSSYTVYSSAIDGEFKMCAIA